MWLGLPNLFVRSTIISTHMSVCACGLDSPFYLLEVQSFPRICLYVHVAWTSQSLCQKYNHFHAYVCMCMWLGLPFLFVRSPIISTHMSVCACGLDFPISLSEVQSFPCICLYVHVA